MPPKSPDPARVYCCKTVARALCVGIAVWSSSRALAHDGLIEVGCGAGNPPKLVVRATAGVLTSPLELARGDALFSGRWAFDVPALATLAHDDADGRLCRPLNGHLIGIQRVHFDHGVTIHDPATLVSILENDGDTFAFVQDDTCGVRLNMMSAASVDGVATATLRFVDLAGLHAASDPFTLTYKTVDVPTVPEFVCPMRCEGSRTYPDAGRCPDCGMKLTDKKAHQNHSPKHGGIFFMAPDGVHHLEGAMAAPGEFRLYIYDEFTRPIPARSFRARGEMRASYADTPFTLRPSGDYFVGRAGGKLRVWVDFGEGESLFEFEFPN